MHNYMTTARLLFQSLRPIQWTKNGFILIPLVFAHRVFCYESVIESLQAVFIFCILSGSVYLINDLIDLEADRRHPVKRHRPIAAGLIPPRTAKIAATVLILLSGIWGVFIGPAFFLVLVAYLTVQILYNYRLKQVVILDIFCVSCGFFLRIVAGAVAIQVVISNWLIICTILMAMFLTLGKRRHELLLLGQAEAINHRKVLSQYSAYLLDQMIGVITGITILSYVLYCISPQTIEKFQTDHLIYTFPFVLYGIFRYLYLIHRKGKGDAPEKVLITDLSLLICVILWGLFCILIIYRII